MGVPCYPCKRVVVKTTMANVSLSVANVAEQYGMLFYIISPAKTSFPTMDDCPDYLQQAMPYMVTLIVLEAVINWWLGKKHNVADSVTSISSGLIMTMVGMLTHGVILSIYSYVHEHYRILELPWDSPITWVTTAVLVDLGYYWFHRASHEVALLWSVHQVHHSSEEFNLTTAFRQPVFQGLFQLTHWFYLPAALVVPPSQFLVHSQFVFLFQFWIHSELIGDIGPLGWIFNTSTFHQVHHGSNRYCLDKNYGGFLSIWDRIFGTFQDLRSDQETVYGLIDQPQFFNVMKHQFFYFKCIQDKVAESTNWMDQITVWFKGPGWFPGLPRLGNNDLCPEIPERKIHYSTITISSHLYLLLQLVGIFIIHDDLSRLYGSMTQGVTLAVMTFILWTLTSISLHYDKHPLTIPMEVSRCAVSLAVYQMMGGWKEGTFTSSAFTVWLTSSLVITLVTSLATGKKKAA